MDKTQLQEDFVQLARMSLTGRPQDIQLLIHRAAKKYKDVHPAMVESLLALLRESPSRSSPLRKQADAPLPVDVDSRLQLLRIEIGEPEQDPILSVQNDRVINQLISERMNYASLLAKGLHPSKSVLLTGPPGVGKTLAAKWIANKLGRPLLILDLAAVMSSYLGRTGNNIRYVLDYAKNRECVLLLDELDAIAKRRDDTSEIGELKRLVTVLLQEIDDWPTTGLLIAATNHPDLLDPAVWRRFDVVVEFDKPSKELVHIMIQRLLDGEVNNVELWSHVLSYIFVGKSFSEIQRQIMLARKTAVISDKPLIEVIPSLIVKNTDLRREDRLELAILLYDSGLVTQRLAYDYTGISRDTIRKYGKVDSKATEKKPRKTAKSVIKVAGKNKSKASTKK
jgi:hypothetical protein